MRTIGHIKQKDQVCSYVLRWAEIRSARQMPTQPESDGERVVGEDKVEWDSAETWQNALTIDDFYVFGGCCAAGSRLEHDDGHSKAVE